MKQYKQDSKGHFRYGGSVIPDNIALNARKKMQKEIDAGEAEIISYEPPSAAEAAKAVKRGAALRYLRETNYHIFAFIEEQVPVPQEIPSKRKQARKDAYGE